jgi:hypothetical protein
MTERIMDQKLTETTDALNFYYLVSTESATNPIVKKLLMSNYLLFSFYFYIYDICV